MSVSRLLCFVLASTLAAMAYAFALSGGSPSVLMFSQLVVLIVPALILLARDYGGLRARNIIFWFIFVSILLINIIANQKNYSADTTSLSFALLHALGISGMLFVLQWASTNLRPETILSDLALLLFPLVALAVVAALNAAGFEGRNSPFDIHPNWWGEVAFALSMCSMFLRNRTLKCVLLGMAFVLFLLVQSRGALAAAVVLLVTYLAFRLMKNRWTARSFLTLFISLCVGVLVLWTQDLTQVWIWVQNQVLLLDDQYRGLGTGLTGRLEGWRAAVAVFFEKPLLGSGLDTMDEVHNGFLRLAAEGGIPLLTLVLLMMGFAVNEAYKRRNYLTISVIIAYSAYAMTYPRMLNMNVASAIFYLCLFSWRSTKRQHENINLRSLSQSDPALPGTT